MTYEEYVRWCMLLHRAITGEHITIICRDMRAARYDFRDCMAVCDQIGLAYEAKRTNGCQKIVIGDTIMDGGIDFSTMQAESRKCGDHRDVGNVRPYHI